MVACIRKGTFIVLCEIGVRDEGAGLQFEDREGGPGVEEDEWRTKRRWKSRTTSTNSSDRRISRWDVWRCF